MIHDISQDLEKEYKQGNKGLMFLFSLLLTVIITIVWLAVNTVSNNY